MKRLLLTLTFLLAGPVGAAEFCVPSFAELGAGEDPAPLVVETYRRLLYEVGVGLHPETVAKIAESEDPFAIPDQDGTDLFTVRKHFARLKEMVNEKGWNTPELRSSLREALRGRQTAQVEQLEKRELALKTKGPPVHQLPIEASNEASISADGRYIVTPVSQFGIKAKEPFIVSVHDTVTKQTTQIEVGKGYYQGPLISPKGDALLLFKDKAVVRWVPFANGLADLARARELGKPQRHVSTVPTVAHFDNDSFVASDGIDNVFIFDPKAGTRARVNLKSYAGKELTPIDWGPFDGKRIWVAVRGHVLDHLEYHVVSVSPAGEVKNFGPSHLHIKPAWFAGTTYTSSVAWADGGKSLFIAPVRVDGVFQVWQNATKRQISLLAKKGEPETTMVKDIVTHPSGKEVAILFEDRFTERSWVEVYDAKTVELKHAFDVVPDTFKMRFVDGGKRLIGNSTKGVLPVVEYPQD